MEIVSHEKVYTRVSVKFPLLHAIIFPFPVRSLDFSLLFTETWALLCGVKFPHDLWRAHKTPECPSRQYAPKSLPPTHASVQLLKLFEHSLSPMVVSFRPRQYPCCTWIVRIGLAVDSIVLTVKSGSLEVATLITASEDESVDSERANERDFPEPDPVAAAS